MYTLKFYDESSYVRGLHRHEMLVTNKIIRDTGKLTAPYYTSKSPSTKLENTLIVSELREKNEFTL